MSIVPRSQRRLVGGLLGLLALLSLAYYLVQGGRDLPAEVASSRVLLFVLWYLDVLLVLAIVVVLARNLLRLAVERHHRILGSRFKSKLVATYIGLSLVPVLLLFAYASELLQRSIDRWFASPVQEVFAEAQGLTDLLIQGVEQTGRRDAARVLALVERADLRAARVPDRLRRRLEEAQRTMELTYLALYLDDEFVNAVVDPVAGLSDLPEPGRRFLEQVVREGDGVKVLPPREDGSQLILVAVAEPTQESPRTIVAIGRLLPPEIATRREKLVSAYAAYRQIEVEKEKLRASHLLLFLTITLIILLAAVWSGLYLARRITVPIQALAAGTRRVSSGDLSYRVEVETDDELGVLVDSFNRMTSELERNRTLLDESYQELVAANHRLDEERSLVVAVLKNVAAGVVAVDRSGRIFICNSAALGMLRQTEAEVIGRRPEESWRDPDRHQLALLFSREIDPAGFQTELRMALAGQWKTFDVKLSGMGEGEGLGGTIMVLEDTTELIKAQKHAAWSAAARRLAHEIKNPLTPIQLAAERILRRHREGAPTFSKTLEEGVAIIGAEVKALKALVDEFSSFARMRSPSPLDLDVARLVEDTVRLYREIKPGVEVDSEVETGLRAWADQEQLRSVLVNLLDNAVEATPPPGRVTVSAHAENGQLEIAVSDSGVGIPAEAKEKLFLPHFSTKKRGTGLGLAIVHRIVSEHHGDIRVEDNHPTGTVFRLTLPRRS